ncbi:hypothetical protein RQM47_03535 [Rubrivirga sp. S365]|uniref:hypothetical protein n=1 Tax=Rubrivirga sp. S365 TaxID=3076080 RepID=UPI0028C599EC|nr:hypothetical protein [Rubrivirga sp. S365]MDT7855705.1 hypothetical protein [Rubrivirga sp. S365]
METAPPPGLVWIDVAVDRCPFTGDRIQVVEAELEVTGIDFPPDVWELGWSEGAQCHFALLEDLFGLSDEAGAPPYGAQGFRLDGDDVSAAVHLTGPGATVPWPVFSERLEEVARRSERPTPTPTEVRRLPKLDETWELSARETDVAEVDGRFVPIYLVVVTDAGGEVRGTALHPGALAPPVLAGVVFEATHAHPEAGLTAGRPARIRFADADLGRGGLKALLKKAHVGLETGPTPDADAASEALFMMGPGGNRLDVALLTETSDDDLSALLDAARGFYESAPWSRLRGDRYLALRLDDGPWLYANVMGQAGEQPGLALFSDWLALCRFVYAAPPLEGQGLEALDEVGPAEGLTLYPAAMLAEADAERLRALGPPVWDGGYPVAARFTPGGAAPSGWPPEIYAALLRALPEVVAKRRAATITSIKAGIDTPEGRLTLRYPANGTEALSGQEPAVEIVVEPAASRMTPLDEGQGALRIVGPAATRLPQADAAARKALRWGHFRAVELDGRVLWYGDAYADDPAPSLDDLAGARSVRVQLGAEMHEARVRRVEGGVEEVRAEVG